MAAMLICCVLICGMVAWFMFGERAVLRSIKAKEKRGKMKAILKKPQSDPEIVEVENELESLHRVLECNFMEGVQIVPNTVAYIDEEGKLTRRMPNLRFGENDVLVGNVLVCGLSGSEERDLTEKEIEQVLAWMEENALSITDAFDVVLSPDGWVVSWEG